MNDLQIFYNLKTWVWSKPTNECTILIRKLDKIYVKTNRPRLIPLRNIQDTPSKQHNKQNVNFDLYKVPTIWLMFYRWNEFTENIRYSNQTNNTFLQEKSMTSIVEFVLCTSGACNCWIGTILCPRLCLFSRNFNYLVLINFSLFLFDIVLTEWHGGCDGLNSSTYFLNQDNVNIKCSWEQNHFVFDSGCMSSPRIHCFIC